MRNRSRSTVLIARTGRRIGPGEPGDEAERREVAEDHVLAHVHEEEVLLAERVDRRVERDDTSAIPSQKRNCLQPGTGVPRRASVRERRR